MVRKVLTAGLGGLLLPGCMVSDGAGQFGVAANEMAGSMVSRLSAGDAVQAGATRRDMDRQISDYRKTVADGVAAGALTGALIATTVVASRDNADTNDIAGAAAKGAAAGALLGGLAGFGMAERKAAQVEAEDQFDAEIEAAQERVTVLAGISEKAAALVTERRATLASLAAADLAERSAFARLAGRDAESIDNALRTAVEDVSRLASLRDSYEETAPERERMDVLMNSYAGIIANLETSSDALRALSEDT